MSGNKNSKILKKKINEFANISDNAFKKKLINNKKYLNANLLYKIENDDDFIKEYSNDLLNENIKIRGMFTPFINPVPCFTVKNDNSIKQLSWRATICKNKKTQKNIKVKKTSKDNNKNNDQDVLEKSEKTKLLNKNVVKSHMDNKYLRPLSPEPDKKKNKIFNSENFELNNIKNNIFITKSNNELIFHKIKPISNKLNNRNKINSSKQFLSYKQKQKIKNHLYYSTENYCETPFLDEYKRIKELEENKNRKIRLTKLLGQKINVATMKIEILQNYKKNKNLNSIRKKIEYNKIYCNNDLQRLKDNYNNNINHHLRIIKYLKIRLIKCEEFLTNKKHNEIINKEKLKFKLKKMELIEKILFLRKKYNDFLKPDSTTNDTHHLDDSLEEQTINDMSLNDFSIMRETINAGINCGYHYNNTTYSNFKEDSLYGNKIIKIKPNEISKFTAKFIKNNKRQKK